MPTITVTVAGGAQFDGLTPATGLFSFAEWNLFPSTTRIALNRISYHSAVPGGGDSGADRIDIYFQDPVGVPTDVILVGRGLAPAITGPDGSVDYGLCGGVVPRRPGLPTPGSSLADHWDLKVVTQGKDVTATVAVDYSVVPCPSSSPEDPIV